MCQWLCNLLKLTTSLFSNCLSKPSMNVSGHSGVTGGWSPHVAWFLGRQLNQRHHDFGRTHGRLRSRDTSYTLPLRAPLNIAHSSTSEDQEACVVQSNPFERSCEACPTSIFAEDWNEKPGHTSGTLQSVNRFSSIRMCCHVTEDHVFSYCILRFSGS